MSRGLCCWPNPLACSLQYHHNAFQVYPDFLFRISQLCQFIPKSRGCLTRAIVTHILKSIVFFSVQELEGKPSNEPQNYLLRFSCRRVDWQLSSATQISSQLSSLLSSALSLSIQGYLGLPTGEEDVTLWFQPFIHVKQVDVWERSNLYRASRRLRDST